MLLKDVIPQFLNGGFEKHIPLCENAEGEFQYDVNIDWQLHQVSYENVKSGISITKRYFGAVQCNNKTYRKVIRPENTDKRIKD